MKTLPTLVALTAVLSTCLDSAEGQDVVFLDDLIEVTDGLRPIDLPNLTADFDEDVDVDGDDFLTWQHGFGIRSGATSSQGDADGDGDVDGVDFLHWQLEFGMGVGDGEDATAVPEPATVAIAAIAAILFFFARVRRAWK